MADKSPFSLSGHANKVSSQTQEEYPVMYENHN